MTTFTDDFNRANSTSLGASWVEVSGDWSIISNQLSSGSAGGTVILRAATAMATNDHYAQITIAATAAVSHGVWCRGDSNISQGYLWRNDGTSWNLFSVVGGSFTSIGSYAAAAVAGDVAKIQAVGSTIKGFVNGIQRVSVTNTDVATGTSVGLRAESTSSLRFDDFSAADVTTSVTGDAALSSTATLSTTGLRATAGSAALTSTAGLTAGGARGTSGAASLSVAASLAADGATSTSSSTALTAAADLTASGQRAAGGDSTLAAAVLLTAGGQRDTFTTAQLAASADLTAQGQAGHSGDSAIAATVALTAGGATSPPAAANEAALSAVAAVTAGGVTAAASGAALAVGATLAADGTATYAHDDVDVTVGAPYSLWAAGQPYTQGWNAQAPHTGDWEVGAPW